MLTDGLDLEKKEELDAILAGKGDTPAKAKRERAAVEMAMRFAK
jgi:hypothetical protein